MSRLIKLIPHETDKPIEIWHKKIRNIKDNEVKLKMLVIEKIMSNPNISGKEVQNTFFISKKIMFEWIKEYNENGLEGLRTKKPEKRGSGRGRTKITDEVYQKLKTEIEQTPDKKWTLKAKRDYIEEVSGERVTEQAVYYRMKKL